jgi:cytoskeleton protein RodZ
MIVPDLTQPVTEPVPETGTSTGRILSDKRQEWDLSIQDVAESLNLGVETIEALESDNYEKLPGTTFVKGYIRAYARLLKLDVEDLMGQIDLQPERITEIPLSRAALKQKGKTRSRDKRNRGGSRFVKWLLTLVILFGLVVFALSQLSRLGIHSLSDLLDPAVENPEDAGGNQLLIPESGGGDTGDVSSQSDMLQANPQSNENGQREALIRIE